VARRLVGFGAKDVTEVGVSLERGEDVDAVAARLRDALGKDLEVHTWRQLEPYVRDTIRRQTAVIDVVALVLLLIVLSSIASTTTRAVHERTAEIGTLLALGFRRRQVQSLFLIEAWLLGSLGSFIGALVGSVCVAAMGATGISLRVLASQ